MATSKKVGKPVRVRQVYEANLADEFAMIQKIVATYRYVSIDTEFPGTVFQSQKPYHQLSPQENYSVMRENVNHLKLIQIGLTFSDSNGNLPDLGSDYCYIWEFNFREFDENEDLHNSDSIKLLKTQGIDFDKNQSEGISAGEFAKLFMASGLGSSFRSFMGGRKESDPHKLTWVFFHSTYDVGYLIKVLTQQELPVNHVTFMALVQIYLGASVFDLKEMVKPFGWQVGLEKVAGYLGVDRIAGQSHQAGSDSLLTLQSFIKLKLNYFTGEQQISMYQKFNHKLWGLEMNNHSLVTQHMMQMKENYCCGRYRRIVYYPCGAATGNVFHPNIGRVIAVRPVLLGHNRFISL